MNPFGLVRYHVLFVIDIATRCVCIGGITSDPNGEWMKQVARNLTDMWDGFLLGKRYLIHDRDPLFTWPDLNAGLEFVCVFGQDGLKPNLYKIWNRLSSGTYYPPPVRIVKIPKSGGGERTLGIPTVGDRVAQTVLKLYLEPLVAPRHRRSAWWRCRSLDSLFVETN